VRIRKKVRKLDINFRQSYLPVVYGVFGGWETPCLCPFLGKAGVSSVQLWSGGRGSVSWSWLWMACLQGSMHWSLIVLLFNVCMKPICDSACSGPATFQWTDLRAQKAELRVHYNFSEAQQSWPQWPTSSNQAPPPTFHRLPIIIIEWIHQKINAFIRSRPSWSNPFWKYHTKDTPRSVLINLEGISESNLVDKKN
jgi:hypothetical protein